MKNVVIALLVIVTIVSGYVAMTSTLRMSWEAMEGKTAVISRGDLTIPVNATGSIRPYRRVQIKSEASGKVERIFKRPGDTVHKDDLLIQLDREEEQRNYDRVALEVKDTKARLEQARIALEQARGPDLKSAEAAVQQIEANLKLTEYRAEWVDTVSPDVTHEEERIQRKSAYEYQFAQLAAAKAAQEQAGLAVRRAQQAVVQSEAVHQAAETALKDAERRLNETSIRSPIDGIMGDLLTQEGEVIQSGKAALTGGTLLGYVLDMGRLTVQAEIDEADIGRVLRLAPDWARPGRDATQRIPENLEDAAESLDHLPVITVESFRDIEFQGIIERIHPEPVSKSHVITYLADVVIVGVDQSLLLPGMRADVTFTSESVTDVLLCPNTAVKQNSEGQLGLYVQRRPARPGDLGIEFVVCEFGLDNGSFSQIECDLQEGDRVYTRLPSRFESGKEPNGRRG